MSDPRHLVPRQVTTHLEFFPGFGLRELATVVAGAGAGYLAYRLGAAGRLDPRVQLVLATVPPVAAFLAAKGGLAVRLARARQFLARPKRLLYQQGSGQMAATGTGAHRIHPLLQWLPGWPVRPTGPQLPRTVQQWLPVADIAGGVIRRRDGAAVAAVRVEPLNLSLLGPGEQARILAAVHEAVNALQHPVQILSLARPLDLDGYLRGLEAQLAELDPARQRLLRSYIRYVSGLVTAGDAQERRYYLLLAHSGDHAASDEVLQSARDLADRLGQADLGATVLTDRELLDLLHVWSHPVQAAFEPPPGGPPAYTTLTRLEV